MNNQRAENYRKTRELLGTQEAVAVLLGVSRQSIARRETGTQKITREAELALLHLLQSQVLDG